MIVRRIARPMLASVFIAAGIEALRNPAARAKRAAQLLDTVSAPSAVQEDPDLFVRVNGATLVGGGALLATGRMPRLPRRSSPPRSSLPPQSSTRSGTRPTPRSARRVVACSSRTSACSAACCWPVSTPRASPGLPGAPSTPRRPRAVRRATPSGQQPGRPAFLAHRAQDVVS